MARKHSIVIGGTKGVGRELALSSPPRGSMVTAVGRTPGEFPDGPAAAGRRLRRRRRGARTRCSPR